MMAYVAFLILLNSPLVVHESTDQRGMFCRLPAYMVQKLWCTAIFDPANQPISCTPQTKVLCKIACSLLYELWLMAHP